MLRVRCCADGKGELEGALVAAMRLVNRSDLPAVRINYLSVLNDLFFVCHHRVVELNSIVLVLEIEFPDEQLF